MSTQSTLRAIEHAERLGSYTAVARLIARHGMRFEDHLSDDVKEEYSRTLSRVAPALAFERVYGAGSLLKLNDPLNVGLIADGIIPAHEIDAAKRHVTRNSLIPQEQQ